MAGFHCNLKIKNNVHVCILTYDFPYRRLRRKESKMRDSSDFLVTCPSAVRRTTFEKYLPLMVFELVVLQDT